MSILAFLIGMLLSTVPLQENATKTQQIETVSNMNKTLNHSYNNERFEKAVEIIKRYETLHEAKHYPYVGYGHKVKQGEKFDLPVTDPLASELLRKDLIEHCDPFLKKFGPDDALLLGTLAYNVGCGLLLGWGKYEKSRLVKTLESGNRNIKDIYLSYNKYNKQYHAGIAKRRSEEFEALYLP